jgi:hypothetical protein
VLLFARRPRDPAAAVMSLALLLTSLASELALPVDAFIPVLAPLLFLLSSTSFITLIFAILMFPEGRLRGGLSIAVAILAGIMAVVAPLVRFEVLVLPFAVGWWIRNLLMILAVVSLFLRYRRLQPGLQQQQIRWALFGFAFAVVLVPVSGLVTQFAYASTAVRWSGVYIAAGAAAGALALTFAVGGLLISLLRYRLYDADAIISRSATFALVTLGLGAGWAGAEKAIEVFLEGTMGHGAGAASAGIAAAIAALLVSPVHQRVHHGVENVFQRKLADLRRTLPEVVGDLRESASLDELLAYVLGRVSGALRATGGAILLQGKDDLSVGAVDQVDEPRVAAWLADFHPVDGQPAHDRADELFPFRHPLTVDRGDTHITVGWIVLGPRPDGSFHSKDELQAVREAAGPIARAIQIVLARRARESAILSELGRLKKEMTTLRRGRGTSGKPAA